MTVRQLSATASSTGATSSINVAKGDGVIEVTAGNATTVFDVERSADGGSTWRKVAGDQYGTKASITLAANESTSIPFYEPEDGPLGKILVRLNFTTLTQNATWRIAQ